MIRFWMAIFASLVLGQPSLACNDSRVDLRIIILEGGGWTQAEARDEFFRAQKAFWDQCQIHLRLSSLRMVNVDDRFLDLALDDDVPAAIRDDFGQTRLAQEFTKGDGVRVFLFRSILGGALGPYTTDLASVASVVGADHPTANDIWMARDVENAPSSAHPDQIRLGHELGHVLLDRASHEDGGRENFMSVNTAERDDSILPIQCLLMKQSHLVH